VFSPIRATLPILALLRFLVEVELEFVAQFDVLVRPSRQPTQLAKKRVHRTL
jgi:hypothetical protein